MGHFNYEAFKEINKTVSKAFEEAVKTTDMLEFMP